MTLSITRAEAPEDLDAARALIRAFFAWAMELVAKGENPNPSVFANLEAEFAGLAIQQRHVMPRFKIADIAGEVTLVLGDDSAPPGERRGHVVNRCALPSADLVRMTVM